MKFANKSKKGVWLAIGYIGGRNTGDDAMLQGLLSDLGPQYSQNIIILSRSEILSLPIAQLGYIVKPFNPRVFLSELVRSVGVIQVGGTIFHDSYPGHRRTRYVLNLALWTTLFLLSRILRKKVLMLGVGIGPFISPIAKVIASLGLRSCQMITLRDNASMREVSKWVPSNRLVKTFDLASLMAAKSNCKVVQKKAINVSDAHSPILGISILLLSAVVLGRSRTYNTFFELFTSELIKYMDKNPDVQIRVFVMWAAPGRENDIKPSTDLVSILENHWPGRTRLISYNSDPSLALEKIRECKAFIATRYHAAVLAYLAGCHLMVVPYHRKVEDFASEIRLNHKALLSPNKDYYKMEIVNKIQLMMSGSKIFQPKLPVLEAILAARINTKILKEFIEDN